MIVRDRPGLGEVLTAMHGSIVPKIAGRLLILAAISVGAVLLHRTLPEPMGHLGAMPFTLIGPRSPCMTTFTMRSGSPSTHSDSASGGARPSSPLPVG